MSTINDKTPGHYRTGGLQPFDVIDAWNLDFYLGNAVKYIARAGLKPGECTVKDLTKAAHYLEEAIKRATNQA